MKFLRELKEKLKSKAHRKYLIDTAPEKIAQGLALGTFISLTPTMGFQMALAVFLATLLRQNIFITTATVWITNPVTVAPIYTFNYWLGTKIWDGPPLSQVSGLFLDVGRTMTRLEFWNIKEQFYAVLQMGKDILIPLLLGSVAIGAVTGLLVYVISLKLLSIFFIRRSQKHLLNHRKPR